MLYQLNTHIEHAEEQCTYIDNYTYTKGREGQRESYLIGDAEIAVKYFGGGENRGVSQSGLCCLFPILMGDDPVQSKTTKIRSVKNLNGIFVIDLLVIPIFVNVESRVG